MDRFRRGFVLVAFVVLIAVVPTMVFAQPASNGGLGTWRRWNQTISRHDLQHFFSIGRAASVDDLVNIPEILGTDVWREDNKSARNLFVGVTELVDRTPRREHPFSRTQMARGVIY